MRLMIGPGRSYDGRGPASPHYLDGLYVYILEVLYLYLFEGPPARARADEGVRPYVHTGRRDAGGTPTVHSYS